jgi:hypothetical protein
VLSQHAQVFVFFPALSAQDQTVFAGEFDCVFPRLDLVMAGMAQKEVIHFYLLSDAEKPTEDSADRVLAI